eukprot:NODE_2753_length_1127_cov_54.145640_g2528_i0.p1 GENE.NODE_2753_length_1127_cov_54.145640_g2528_i0~~NODE_2753_length_1127_cov_54.145640_g2528_i0.p1  ORF type:complete len:315 (-),score=34.21 NODE_2753_length_1127_cov_54.145640_g2528_i0:183-1064(-)
MHPEVQFWDSDDVFEWLHECGLSQYGEIFQRECIDGQVLFQLTSGMLLDELQIRPLGHRLRLLQEIANLKSRTPGSSNGESSMASSTPVSSFHPEVSHDRVTVPSQSASGSQEERSQPARASGLDIFLRTAPLAPSKARLRRKGEAPNAAGQHERARPLPPVAQNCPTSSTRNHPSTTTQPQPSLPTQGVGGGGSLLPAATTPAAKRRRKSRRGRHYHICRFSSTAELARHQAATKHAAVVLAPSTTREAPVLYVCATCTETWPIACQGCLRSFRTACGLRSHAAAKGHSVAS